MVRARDSNPEIFQLPCGKKFLREFIFADWRFVCVLRELIFAIRTDWFFLLGNNFCDFQKVLSPLLDNIFVLLRATQIYIFKRYYGMRTLCKTSILLYTA